MTHTYGAPTVSTAARCPMTQSMGRRGNGWERLDGMARLFRSLKSEWLPTTGYINLREVKRNSSYYLMVDYHWRRPPQHHDGIPPRVGPTGCLDVVDHGTSALKQAS